MIMKNKKEWNTSYRVSFKYDYSITDFNEVYEPVVRIGLSFSDEVWGVDEDNAREAALDSFWQEFYALNC